MAVYKITAEMLAGTGAVAVRTATGRLRGIVRGPARIETDEPLALAPVTPPIEPKPPALEDFDRLPIGTLLLAAAELAGLSKQQVVDRAKQLLAVAQEMTLP